MEPTEQKVWVGDIQMWCLQTSPNAMETLDIQNKKEEKVHSRKEADSQETTNDKRFAGK